VIKLLLDSFSCRMFEIKTENEAKNENDGSVTFFNKVFVTKGLCFCSDWE